LSDNVVAPPTTHNVHVGRQPLYDRAGAVAGYELLFRGEAGAVSASEQGAYATSQVLVSAFTEFGLEHLVADRIGFVNVTREFLVGELPLPFAPGQAVLEVLETVPVDDEVLAGVTALVDRGYQIALDDFQFNNSSARLLDLASYVKIDMLGIPPSILTALAIRCRVYPRLKLVAERVDTEEQLALAHKLGFELFQGYALARPQVLTTVALAPSRLTTLRLLALVNDEDADMTEVATEVSQDPALTVRLLKAANSASAALNRTLESVRDAAVLIGLNQLRQ